MDSSVAPTVSDLSTWKQQARAGSAPADAILRKGYTADQVKAEEGDSRKVAFTISTGAVDRDRDTVKVDGWDVESYLKNPVVLWAHSYSMLPIGRAESVKKSGGALKATAVFATAEMNPLAESVYQMLKGGFLRATSVGFRPMKHAYDEERGGFDILEQELLEFSVVPVPANPQALMDAKAAGIDMAPVKGWAELVLDGIEPGLWVPKERVLAAFKTLSEPRVFVLGDFSAEFEKRGRTLSAANESRIRGAADAASAIGAALDEVLAQVALAEPEEPKSAALYVLPSHKASITVDPEVVKAAVRAAVSDTVQGELRYAMGRID